MTHTPIIAPVSTRSCGVEGCIITATRYGRFCEIHAQARRRKKRKHIPTAAGDEAIREAYRLFWEYNNRRAIKMAARRLGWPHWAVTRRAQVLGLAHPVERTNWTPEEEQVLSRFAHNSDIVIARKLKEAGFHRTATAVHLKCKRDRIKATLNGYSAHQLAEAFGVDGHKITRWIAAGLVKAERREQGRTPQQGGNAFWIKHTDVRDFVLRCPDEVDLKKVEKWWFLDLLTDGRICRQ
jgi:hypothetical protein